MAALDIAPLLPDSTPALPSLDLLSGTAELLGGPDEFPDQRLFKRAGKAVHTLLLKFCPSPQIVARALQKGFNRFVTNPRLQGGTMVARVLDTNARSVVQQAQDATIVAAHDTTENDKHGRGVP